MTTETTETIETTEERVVYLAKKLERATPRTVNGQELNMGQVRRRIQRRIWENLDYARTLALIRDPADSKPADSANI